MKNNREVVYIVVHVSFCTNVINGSNDHLGHLISIIFPFYLSKALSTQCALISNQYSFPFNTT